jgi:hypothetical protein
MDQTIEMLTFRTIKCAITINARKRAFVITAAQKMRSKGDFAGVSRGSHPLI